ncbi:MAG: Rrf2 family transcriptional regulator [Elusimicrobiota bacterium]
MLKISSSVEYGSRVIVHLAAQDPQDPLTAEKIAASENIPRDYVDQLLMRLRRAGLVISRRGARGGYLLAKPTKEISVGSVMRAVDAGVFESICEKYAEGDQQCSRASDCGIRPVWQRLGVLIEKFLDSVSITELQATESRVAKLFADVEKP